MKKSIVMLLMRNTALPGWKQILSALLPFSPASGALLIMIVAGMGYAHAGPAGIAYSIGAPTAKEQLHVELINRARANPTAEGVRLAALASGGDASITGAAAYFNVDLTALQAEFVTGSASGKPTLVVAPPLSINTKLTAAARQQAQDQITWDYQGHQSHDGSWPWDRVTAQGYSWSSVAENAFTASLNPLHAHAGFNIDWGGSDAGMQGPPRGHRSNIHSTASREIGVGNLTSIETAIPPGNVKAKGPEVVVQVFATAQGSTPFITGVVYYDFNGNAFYDPGEGIGGVEVGATGSTYKGVTASSGGYSIPVPGNSSYPMEFWLPGASSASRTTSASVTGGLNVKADWVPAVPAVSLSGSAGAVAGASNTYTASTFGGATSYDLHHASFIASPATENADGGSSGYTLTPGASGYLAAETTGAYSGKSFHFGHNGISSPTVTLTRVFLPGASASLSFRSRLRSSTTSEIASAQARIQGTAEWTTLWTQAGTGGSGESSYNLRSASLAAFNGQPTEIRFVFSYAGGSYYPASATSGWFIDDISFTGTSELSGETVTGFSGPALAFTPSATGQYLLWVQPRLADPLYKSTPVSPMLAVTAYSTGYGAWVATKYPGTGAPSADDDVDGIKNGVEYAFGLDPSTPTPSSALPQIIFSAGSVGFDYTQPANVHGVTYAAEWSDDLTNWQAVPDTGANGRHVFSLPFASHAKAFLRHRITVTP